MKVKDLISALSKLDPETRVLYKVDEDSYWGNPEFLTDPVVTHTKFFVEKWTCEGTECYPPKGQAPKVSINTATTLRPKEAHREGYSVPEKNQKLEIGELIPCVILTH